MEFKKKKLNPKIPLANLVPMDVGNDWSKMNSINSLFE